MSCQGHQYSRSTRESGVQENFGSMYQFRTFFFVAAAVTIDQLMLLAHSCISAGAANNASRHVIK